MQEDARMVRLTTILLVGGLMAGMAQAQPTITQQPTNEVVASGRIATFTVGVSGTGPFSYQWQCNGTNISPGIIRTVTGTGIAGYSGDGGQATNAQINRPSEVLADKRGRMFIADAGNGLVRMVDTNGVISTVAGNGQDGDTGDGGPATNASLGGIVGMAMDDTGNLFLSDIVYNVVRKVDTNGIITTVMSGCFYGCTGLCVDSRGDIFAASQGDVNGPYVPGLILEANTNGIITDAAGGGQNYPGIGGPATNAFLLYPNDVAIDSAGDLFIAEDNVVCKVDTNGIVSEVAGVFLPTSVKVDASGNVFIVDYDANRIDEVMAADGTVAVVAGNSANGYSGDGGPATSAELNYPYGVGVEATGNIFIADTENSRVREVTRLPPYPVNLPRFCVANASKANNGNYSVVVTGSGGSVTSSVVSLSVLDLPPVLTSRPSSQVAFAGQSVSFSVATQGSLPMNYQWTFDGTNLDGQTGAILTLPLVSTNNAGSYTIIVSNAFGCVTSSPAAMLTVVRAPINLMAMGDSVTARGGAPESSYRYWLYTYLTNAGFSNTMFVGSQSGVGGASDGPPAHSWPQTAYEGGPSATGLAPVADDWTTRDGLNDAFKAAGVLNTGYPGATILLLDLGANDYKPGSGRVGAALAQMQRNLEAIIQTFYRTNSNTVVLLAVPTPWAVDRTNRMTRQFMFGLGRAITDVATNQRKAGVNVVVVNLAAGFNPARDTKDGKHPNVRGEQMIAKDYFNALRPILKQMEKKIQAQSCAPAPSNIEAWWPAEGDAHDIVGTNNGVLLGGLGFTNGEVGQGFWFTTTNQGVILPASPGLDIGRTEGWTMECWLKPSDLSTPHAIAEWNNGIDGIELIINAEGTGDIFVGNWTVSNGYKYFSLCDTGPGLLVTNAFQHVALTCFEYGATGLAAVYYNGRLVAQAGLENNYSGTGYNFYLGYSPSEGMDFAGVLDEVGYYGRVLSSVEISNIYNAGVAGKCPLPPTVAIPPATQPAVVGQAVTFTVDADGSSPTYQWLFNGNPLAGCTNASLTLPSVTTNNAGNYAVVVSNPVGVVTSLPPAVLTVYPAPFISSEPVDQTVPMGGNVTLSVGVSISGPFTCQYQWLHDGTNLPQGIITTVAGNGTNGYSGDGGPATSASLNNPYAVAADAQGNLFIADYGNSVIRKVNASGIITTVAGNGTNGFSGDGGAAIRAELNSPAGVVVDSLSNVFIADSVNGVIRKVTANGIITTAVGGGTNSGTDGLGDCGAATNASLYNPSGMAMDNADNLFIADTYHQRIRKVDSNGIITTVAGDGTYAYLGDGGPATNCSLSDPPGVAVDAFSNLFILDNEDCMVREVNASGIITTIAGDFYIAYSGDGGKATDAALHNPLGAAADRAGNLLIADTGNQRIRKVDTNDIITTLAGNGTMGYSGDNGAATNASLNSPLGLAFDGDNNLFIADRGNNVIRKVFLNQGPALSMHNVTAAKAGSYQVIVTGPAGCLTSSIVNLTVATSP